MRSASQIGLRLQFPILLLPIRDALYSGTIAHTGRSGFQALRTGLVGTEKLFSCGLLRATFFAVLEQAAPLSGHCYARR